MKPLSGCVRTACSPDAVTSGGTSCHHFVPSLMAATDLLQVVPGNTGCLKQVVTRLLSSTF